MKKAFVFLAVWFVWPVAGQQKTLPSLPLDDFQDGIHHWNLLHAERNYPRLRPDQVTEIADNFLAYQNEDGGWPKNLDWLGVLDADSVKRTLTPRYRESTASGSDAGTFLAPVHHPHRQLGT